MNLLQHLLRQKENVFIPGNQSVAGGTAGNHAEIRKLHFQRHRVPCQMLPAQTPAYLPAQVQHRLPAGIHIRQIPVKGGFPANGLCFFFIDNRPVV